MVIEPKALIWLVGSMDAITVECSRAGIRQECMPDFIRIFWQLDAFDFVLALSVEQAKLDFGRVRREQSEVYAKAGPGRATRVWRALFQTAARHDLRRPEPSARIQASPVM